MNGASPYGVYGYRFSDPLEGALHQLYAVGCQYVSAEQSYEWDGMERIDGPLFLFQYTVSGCGCLDMDGRSFDVGPGHALMVEIPSKHKYYLPEHSSHWEFYFVQIRPFHLEKHWSDFVQSHGFVPQIPPESPVIRTLRDMYHTARKDRIADAFQASSLVYQFMMELSRHNRAAKKEKSAWPDGIRLAVEAIETRYASLQSLEEIAHVAGLSKYHFTRSFHALTGYTPIAYLTKIRMQKAVELLHSTTHSVEQIAQMIGYASGSYMIKVFREWVGSSPGEFRTRSEFAAVSRLQFD